MIDAAGNGVSESKIPIIDKRNVVGYAENLANGKQRIYYITGGYPKRGMPMPGTYNISEPRPQGRRQSYNKAKTTTSDRKRGNFMVVDKKKINKLMELQAKNTERWL